jgi:hypothetical protein
MYQLNVVNRLAPGHEEACVPGNDNYPRNGYVWRVELQLPGGGGTRTFRPSNGGDMYQDGYFNVSPNGVATSYALTTVRNDPDLGTYAQCGRSEGYTTTGMTYYSSDGSASRLFIPWVQNGNSDSGFRRWTL